MAPDSRAAVPPDAGCDTSDMLVVHGLLRHVHTAAPTLVAGVTDGDVARANVVADHLDFLTRFLHNHHQTEDLVIWDKLSARSPGCAIHVELMKRQHHRVGALLDSLQPRVAAWRADGSGTERAAVERLLRDINDTLFDHLGQEEAKILPEIAVTWTQKEWDQLGKHARGGVAMKNIMILIGFTAESMPEDVAKEMWRDAPALLKMLYRLYGRRRFEEYRRRLYGLAA